MRKLNTKNKIFIFIFSFIVLSIIVIMGFSIRLTDNKKTTVYDVNSNTVLFSKDSSEIDTNMGGKIEKKWNGDYYYLTSDNSSYELGSSPVVYDSSSEVVTIFGKKYQVMDDGYVVLNTDDLAISESSASYFYKLEDRIYLIISPEIYNSDKSIYASKYLIVFIDKQGNASVLNDVINLKTINPMNLVFGDYTFDVANERLIIGDNSIDLKTVIGSSNEYIPIENREKMLNYDSKKLVESYNQLVNNFSQYANNHGLNTSGNNQVGGNNIVINGTGSTSAVGNTANAENKTNITKRVSLRGAVSNTSYIDVSYIVTDPEDKYQVVYILVTGDFDGVRSTQKIIVDKYETGYRVYGLTPNNEYTISLGYIEVITDDDGEKKLSDQIEDVINVRTSRITYTLKIDKISGGYVYFTFKMPASYAFESSNVVLVTDGVRGEETVSVDYQALVSGSGFSSRLPMADGILFDLRVENGYYGGELINTEISRKFRIA